MVPRAEAILENKRRRWVGTAYNSATKEHLYSKFIRLCTVVIVVCKTVVLKIDYFRPMTGVYVGVVVIKLSRVLVGAVD